MELERQKAENAAGSGLWSVYSTAKAKQGKSFWA
jgi:hypothetical protein